MILSTMTSGGRQDVSQILKTPKSISWQHGVGRKRDWEMLPTVLCASPSSHTSHFIEVVSNLATRKTINPIRSNKMTKLFNFITLLSKIPPLILVEYMGA